MTAYSFTGPSRLTLAEALVAVRTVEKLDRIAGLPSVIATGAAPGWDMEVALAAVGRWPKARHVLVTPAAAWDEANGDRWLNLVAMARCDYEIVRGPESLAQPYRLRNELLVDRCDVLIAGLRGTTFYRSGEWMTVNIGLRAGKLVHRINLDHPLNEGAPL